MFKKSSCLSLFWEENWYSKVVILSRILKFYGFWKCLRVDGWTTWYRANCKKCESRPRDGKICSAVKTWLASLLFQRKIERWSDCSSRKQGMARWRTTLMEDPGPHCAERQHSMMNWRTIYWAKRIASMEKTMVHGFALESVHWPTPFLLSC